MQPVSQMPGFWTFMYKVSPYTYFIQSYMGVVLHDRPVECSDDEYNVFNPPQGMTCREFAQPFVENVSGYIENLDATSGCRYCQYRVGDEYLSTIGVKYSYRWRNVGFMCAYIIFNIVAMLGMYYLFRVKTWTTPKWIENLSKKKAQRKASKKPQEEADEVESRDIYEKQEGDDERVFTRRSSAPTTDAGNSHANSTTS